MESGAPTKIRGNHGNKQKRPVTSLRRIVLSNSNNARNRLSRKTVATQRSRQSNHAGSKRCRNTASTWRRADEPDCECIKPMWFRVGRNERTADRQIYNGNRLGSWNLRQIDRTQMTPSMKRKLPVEPCHHGKRLKNTQFIVCVKISAKRLIHFRPPAFW